MLVFHAVACYVDRCNDWSTLKSVARDDIAPFVVASFDIECNSSTGKFYDADVPDDIAPRRMDRPMALRPGRVRLGVSGHGMSHHVRSCYIIECCITSCNNT